MDKSDVPIATPCTLDWRKMKPAEGGRFCGDCKKVVRDLSQMTERSARALLAERGGDLCVRYLYDRHGRVFFAGDREKNASLLSPSLLSRAKRAAIAAATVAMPLAVQACDGIASPLGATDDTKSHLEEQHPPDERLHEAMGGAPALPREDAPDAQPDAEPQPPDGGADAAPDAAPDASVGSD